jgi:hypothetical protein
MRADVEERHPGALAMHAAQQRERRHRAGADGATSTSDASKASAASTTESDAEADTTVSALLGKAVKQSVSKLHRMGATEHDKGGALHVPEDGQIVYSQVSARFAAQMIPLLTYHMFVFFVLRWPIQCTRAISS